MKILTSKEKIICVFLLITLLHQRVRPGAPQQPSLVCWRWRPLLGLGAPEDGQELLLQRWVTGLRLIQLLQPVLEEVRLSSPELL